MLPSIYLKHMIRALVNRRQRIVLPQNQQTLTPQNTWRTLVEVWSLPKSSPKRKCLNVIGVRQEYSGGGGSITSTFRRGKVYFSDENFS